MLTPLRWWHWTLIGLGARRRIPESVDPWPFNLMQAGLAALTVFALYGLFGAVQRGLLGLPEMMVLGNGSSAWYLRWFADRIAPVPPRCTVISLPLLAYHLAMLAWALWLAFALLGWLRWGWEGFSDGGFWKPMHGPKMRFRRKAETSTETSAESGERPGWEPEGDG